jgi:predicted nucleic acid-binding protein
VTLYLDSSALLKRYIEEPDSSQFTTILAATRAG